MVEQEKNMVKTREEKDIKAEIPKEILEIDEKLKKAGFESFLVGGCVRDLVLNRKPKDWDFTTNAKPEEILRIFKRGFYDNKFGTVGIVNETEDETLKVVEITPYRKEGKYTDKRHPDEIKFADKLEEDLKRRDFTINALALQIKEEIPKPKLILIDLFDGLKDLENKIIRTVGEPDERFNEDALRLMRAVRFAAELDFEIEEKTKEAIKRNAHLIELIAKERIRDELIKILESKNPKKGIELLEEVGLLQYIIPELRKGIGVTQNWAHIYDVFKHSVFACQAAADCHFSLEVRLAALFHDIAKPDVKKGEGPDATFYNHDIVGAKETEKILKRLRFPKKTIEKVVRLVKNHMFNSDPQRLTEHGARRLWRRIADGREINDEVRKEMRDLINLRIADRMGMEKKPRPFRLRAIEALLEKVSRDPISEKMLKVNGYDVMEILKIGPGIKVGAILKILLAEVLEDPKKNEENYLRKRIEELGELSDESLIELKKSAQLRIEKEIEKEEEEIRKKYF
jgi:poly(A) polymerase/tRNA nucleotidyltransferase (CCA-adding enzyme)